MMIFCLCSSQTSHQTDLHDYSGQAEPIRTGTEQATLGKI